MEVREVRKPLHFYRDVAVGILFALGMLCFMFGEFIISTVLFCAATLCSNLSLGGKTLQA
jgi:hypothetical protein